MLRRDLRDEISQLRQEFYDKLNHGLEEAAGTIGGAVGEIERDLRGEIRAALDKIRDRIERLEQRPAARSIIGPPGPRGEKGEGVAEVEARLAALEQHIVRKSKPRGGTTDFDFNEARALTRN